MCTHGRHPDSRPAGGKGVYFRGEAAGISAAMRRNAPPQSAGVDSFPEGGAEKDLAIPEGEPGYFHFHANNSGYQQIKKLRTSISAEVRSFLFRSRRYHLYAEGVDILLRVIGGPVADDGEEEHISVRDKAVPIHEILHSVQGFLAVVEIGTLNI